MHFPRWVMKSPGPIKVDGGSIAQKLVANQAEYDAALAAGYSPSVPEALAAARNAVVVTAPVTTAEPPAPEAPVEPQPSQAGEAHTHIAAPAVPETSAAPEPPVKAKRGRPRKGA